MGKKLQFQITKSMVRDLCAESSRARLLHRLHCVALVAHGLSASKVARIFDDSPRAVAYWVKRFNQNGLMGLEEEARPGRPSKLNKNQQKKLQTFVKAQAAHSKPLTAERLAAYISKEFGITLTVVQCWRILKRLNS